MTVHVHLDPIGGVSGDMFVAGLLDAFPEHAAASVAAAERVAGVPCRLVAHRDHVLTGARFLVEAPGGMAVECAHGHQHDDENHHHHREQAHGYHERTAWQAIRARLQVAELPHGARARAIGIFAVLAGAEAAVHGIAPDDVMFHEVGAADSVADIVAAAFVIDAIGPTTWSVAPLPMGGGRISTAHGIMPVPAPAVALLLEGFDMIDDGVGGERVTPTGAAILRHLGCQTRHGLAGRLAGSGVGFGTRSLPTMSNVLRVLTVAPTHEIAAAGVHRALAVVTFEVDDQSAEDLACGLDHIRTVTGVHDVMQIAVFGKKGRIATQVQVLAAPERLEPVVQACFRETTTIGLRTAVVQARALSRTMRQVEVDGAAVRVKRVMRPGGATGKAEADDSRALAGHAARARLRRRAEAAAEEENAV
jgi:uncharacterized protein (TIGR00299 family) protein